MAAFWVKVDRTSDCWLWLGRRNRAGYGRYGGKLAHRLAYEMSVGPIPEGMTIDHICRNRSCVNPAHMEPVSFPENIRRAVPFRTYVLVTHCRNGHKYTPENTYRTGRGTRNCRLCNREAQRRLRAARIPAQESINLGRAS